MARKDLSKDPINLQAMWRKAKKFYYELKKTGLSDTVIAAILGNIAQESSFDPKARAGSHTGYIQNQKEIVNWVIKHFGGYDHIHQMNYLIAGLTQKLPDKISQWGKELNTRFNTFLQGLTNNISVAQATKLWETSYEKSGGQALQQRINYANYFYKQILEGNKTTPVRKTPKIKQKNKTVAYQIPEITYPQENPKFLEPQQEYIAQTNNTYDSLPLFFDFKNYQTPEAYEPQSVEQTKTEFDLPLFATNFKKGGKLIKRGQREIKVAQTTPFNVEIYLEKDPISHPELQTYIQGLDPEERMDEVVQQLTPQYNPITQKLNQNNTYSPTKEQQNLKMIYHDDPAGDVVMGLITLPFGGTAIKYTPKLGQILWGAIKQTMKNPKPFLKNLVYDTGAWIGLNEGTRLATGKTLDQKLNWSMGFPEDSGPAFLLTGTAAGMGRRLVGKGINQVRTILSQPVYSLQTENGKVSITDLNNTTHKELGKSLRQRIRELNKVSPDLNLEEIPENESKYYTEALKNNGFVSTYNGETPEIVGKVNLQNEPLVQTAVNLLNYRMHNKFNLVKGFTDKMNSYFFDVSKSKLPNIVVPNNTEKFVDQLGKNSSLITTIRKIDPKVVGAHIKNGKYSYTQIGKLGSIKDIIRTFMHENVGHNLNKLLRRFNNPIFGKNSMLEVYEELENYHHKDLIGPILDKERDLTVDEIEATLIESLPEFLEDFARYSKMDYKTLLQQSIQNPEKLDIAFDKFIMQMPKEDFAEVLYNTESVYSSIMANFMPGNKGLAYYGKMLNFISRGAEGTSAQRTYDAALKLKENNKVYTTEQAENYMNILKNIIGKGFSISAILSTLYNTQNENQIN